MVYSLDLNAEALGCVALPWFETIQTVCNDAHRFNLHLRKALHCIAGSLFALVTLLPCAV